MLNLRHKLNKIAAYYESREYNKAIREIMALTDKANKYIDEKAPWVIAKEEGKEGRITSGLLNGHRAFPCINVLLKTGSSKTG